MGTVPFIKCEGEGGGAHIWYGTISSSKNLTPRHDSTTIQIKRNAHKISASGTLTSLDLARKNHVLSQLNESHDAKGVLVRVVE